MRSDVAIRSARIRLVPGDIRARRRAPRNTRDLPLARRDTRVPPLALEGARDPQCVPNDTGAPRLVQARTRDRPTRRDMSLETHTAADMRCISSLFKI